MTRLLIEHGADTELFGHSTLGFVVNNAASTKFVQSVLDYKVLKAWCIPILK